MTMYLQDIINAARDADQAFAQQRVTNAVFARFLTRYQKELVGMANEVNPGIIASQISLVFPSPGLPSITPIGTIGAGTGTGLPVGPTTSGLPYGTTGQSVINQVVGNTVELDFPNAIVYVAPIVVTVASTNTVTVLGSPNWAPNGFADGLTYLEVVTGTDVGDRRLISSNTQSTITVSQPFTVTPDTTSMIRVVKPSTIVTQETAAVLAMPAVSTRQSYLIQTSATGQQYIDLTQPLTAYMAQGIQLPQYKVLLDGTCYFTPSQISGEQDNIELTINDPTNRLRAQGRYNAYERNGQLFLIGNWQDWQQVQSIDIRYVPEPGNLVNLTDAFILPDSAYSCLVAQASRFAAERVYNRQDSPNVDLDWYRLASEAAEKRWLFELGTRNRAKTSVVKEVWVLLVGLGLSALLANPVSATSAARPTPSRSDPVHVVAAQEMPALAMGFASIASGGTTSTQDVVSVRGRFKMPRIDAVTHTAEMVKCYTESDWSSQPREGFAMRESCDSISRAIADSDKRITPTVDATRPQPALATVTKFLQSFIKGHSFHA